MTEWLAGASWFWWWPSPQVTIEEGAGALELPRLAAIHADCFAHDWSADDLDALLRDEHVFIVVARRGNAFGTRSPVGFALIRFAADEAEILTVAVDPRHRGRGIGRAILDAANRRLYRERVTRVFLEVEAGNDAALALYRRLGFVKVGERRGYYAAAGASERATALVMRADLR